MKHEPHTMNGQSKKEKNLYALAQTIGKLTWSHITLALSIIAMLFAGFGFVRNTQSVNKDVPAIKNQLLEHGKKDDEKYFLFINSMNDLKIAVNKIDNKVDLVNQKVDDMKAYGVGEYHKETKEAIKKSK